MLALRSAVARTSQPDLGLRQRFARSVQLGLKPSLLLRTRPKLRGDMLARLPVGCERCFESRLLNHDRVAHQVEGCGQRAYGRSERLVRLEPLSQPLKLPLALGALALGTLELAALV